MREAIADATQSAPERFRISEFSAQTDHIHLIVEAESGDDLIEGVRGLCIRLARRINPLLTRKGRLFADRWQGRPLETPRAVRDALVTVFGSFRSHEPARAAPLDLHSSAPYFRDFVEFDGTSPLEQNPRLLPRALARAPDAPDPVSRPKSWLLTTGWKRHGKLSLSEAPSD